MAEVTPAITRNCFYRVSFNSTKCFLLRKLAFVKRNTPILYYKVYSRIAAIRL